MSIRFLLIFSLGLFISSCQKKDVGPLNDNFIPPTCLDGIQNGAEIGIDCGGKDCSMCGPPTAGSFFYGIIDDKETIIRGSNIFGATICSSETASIYKNGASWIADPANSQVLDAGIFLTKGFIEMANATDLYEMYLPGSYPFGTCENGISGAQIEWFDKTTIVWRSELGDQSGSSFNITSRSPIDGNTVEVAGNFSCKLYFGNKAKVITSGQFKFQLALF